MCSTLDHRTLDSTSCPCDPRYYEDGTNFACGKCHYSCYTCDDNGGGNSNECITCSAGDHRHIYNADYCSCDDHYYDINDTFTCGECYSYCATCVDSNTNDDCLSCMNMTNFHRHYSEGDSNTKCPCDRHYYEVDYLDTSADDACAECHPTC